MAAKLKVFKAPVGFHDAYVAVPSRKAALEAWGAQSNLFASGAAEQVTEPKLMEAPLAQPGKVIKVPRGTVEQHLAALPKDTSRTAKRARPTGHDSSKAAKSPQVAKPRPGRAGLDEAEGKLDRQSRTLSDEIASLEAERKRLADQIVDARKAGEKRRDELESQVDQARAKYEKAMALWRKSE
ncbi:hypothetical protein [Novosphingobium sp. Rr 2-17]|uniref:hypothetical protein n=1 Tax=Novosphingobium sp. Rr 2-17 TaxID=555793 RepID=UPI0002E5131A|nr:hypothetical protein [Novosphingobium sp. Rr 2-17]